MSYRICLNETSIMRNIYVRCERAEKYVLCNFKNFSYFLKKSCLTYLYPNALKLQFHASSKRLNYIQKTSRSIIFVTWK